MTLINVQIGPGNADVIELPGVSSANADRIPQIVAAALGPAVARFQRELRRHAPTRDRTALRAIRVSGRMTGLSIELALAGATSGSQAWIARAADATLPGIKAALVVNWERATERNTK